MTPQPPDAPSFGGAAPPPGCPAHGLNLDGVRALYGPEAESDPMGLYEKLRKEHGAVAPVLVHGGLTAWLVLGHRENLEVMRTPSLFSRDSRRWRDMSEGRVPPEHPLAPITGWQPLCVFVDGVEHERLRKAVTESLSRFEARGIRRYVNRFAHQLIDAFAASGQTDLVSQFAEHLPLRVMTQLFGMPEEYGPRLVEAARDMLQGSETAVASNDYLTETLQQLVERKRVNRGHDFPSMLIEHPADLTDDEIREHLRLILTAANETTVNLLANAARMVLTDRRFRANLAGGHMTLPDALEQVMWDEPPMMTLLGRWATSDTELAEQHIKAGDMLLLGLGAGNVDPAIRPDLSVSLHGNRSHLAFSSGPHECPGQHIARAIADGGLDTLLTRLPDLRLGVQEGELRWTSSLMYRHLVDLPVEFTPRRKASSREASVEAESPKAALPPLGRESATATVPPAGPPRQAAPHRSSLIRRLLGRR